MNFIQEKRISNRFKIFSTLFGAFAGGSYWCTVRPSGYGSGPSMGLMWGLLWILLIHMIYPKKKMPSHTGFLLLVFIIGFGLGGTQGYGQFNQWMRGRFYLDTTSNQYIPISRIFGFYHLFICGLTWGGFPALFISWVFFSENKIKDWLLRIILGIAGYFLFQLLLSEFPAAFLPYYEEGFYSNLSTCPDCQRTIDTAKNTYGYLGIFLLLSFITIYKQKKSAYFIVPISIGFALSFSNGGFLHNLQVQPGLSELPWWKMWEFTCGFGGGLSIMLTFWLIWQKGLIRVYIQKNEEANHNPKIFWWGFWIPFFIAVGELARDRIHQVAKLYLILYNINIKDEFFYLEMGAIAVVFLAFIIKLGQFWKKRNMALLLIEKPETLFLRIYSGFFFLIMFRWVIYPFTWENNIISLLAFSSYLISVFLFQKLRKVKIDKSRENG